MVVRKAYSFYSGELINIRLTGMVMSSTANRNASSNMCHYRQEALDESIGACTNNINVALCTYSHGKGIATVTKLHYFTRYV